MRYRLRTGLVTRFGRALSAAGNARKPEGEYAPSYRNTHLQPSNPHTLPPRPRTRTRTEVRALQEADEPTELARENELRMLEQRGRAACSSKEGGQHELHARALEPSRRHQRSRGHRSLCVPVPACMAGVQEGTHGAAASEIRG
eukprot:6214578-Pleurochrysis_carterae.AAC.1